MTTPFGKYVNFLSQTKYSNTTYLRMHEPMVDFLKETQLQHGFMHMWSPKVPLQCQV